MYAPKIKSFSPCIRNKTAYLRLQASSKNSLIESFLPPNLLSLSWNLRFAFLTFLSYDNSHIFYFRDILIEDWTNQWGIDMLYMRSTCEQVKEWKFLLSRLKHVHSSLVLKLNEKMSITIYFERIYGPKDVFK